ncbi:MAG TPA: FliA/WhiG family RNA polymerase sigma factor [Gemmatimonadales bacterium]|nr:FliA/WhiG family RNA polymerase sigma factor [Gemmatimonadales bacterium]
MENSLLRERSAETDRDIMLNEHLGLVHFIARQVQRGLSTEADFDELVSAGTLGLMAAHESFEPERGLAFSTFAAPRIRGSILDELRRQDHVPRSVRRKARELSRAREALASGLGREPSERELAEHMGVELKVLWQWEADVSSAAPVSLDQPRGDDGSAEFSPTMLAPRSTDATVEDELTQERELELMRDAVLGLKDQERTVLTLYYFEELRLHEIATVLGLTESRVSQIRSKAISRLREKLGKLRE